MALRLSEPIRRPQRFFSRISVRLMAFNLLLVFIPIGGILYLGIFESHLVDREYHALSDQSALVAASIARDRDPLAVAAGIVAADVGRMDASDASAPRFRIVDRQGNVIGDSRPRTSSNAPKLGSTRRNWLYRAASAIGRPVLRLLRLSDPPLEESDRYDREPRLVLPEVQTALRGQPGRAKRFSSRDRLVVLYAAAPMKVGDRVEGAVLAEESTAAILRDLGAVRLGVLRIFVASVLAALLLSFYAALTIVRPLRQLRLEAARIDRRAAPPRHFSASRKRDEIGELSRSLERLTRRLSSYARFIDNFASDLSHEFKNPLASVRTATEMLADIEDPRERRRFGRMVEQDIARMEHLLDDVREITSIDTRLISEPRPPVVLREVVAKIVEGMALREHDRVRFDVRADEAFPTVNASEERIFQVVENVLDNAVSFSPDGGVVTVDLERREGFVIIRVSDEGPGIPPEHLSRIFDRFFTWRPDQPKRSSRHTGLGLAIVRRIVEGYGGTITAANRDPRGAVFEIRLRV